MIKSLRPTKLSVFVILTSMLITFLLISNQVNAQDQLSRYVVQDVSATSHDGNFPENTLDDNLATRWSAQGSGEWIQFNLGSIKEVGYLGIAFHNGATRSSTIDIELSEDGENWDKVVDQQQSSGDSNNLEAFAFESQQAQYVRIIGHGNESNNWNSITAVHIYAPVDGDPIVEELDAFDAGKDPDAEPFVNPGLVNPNGTEYIPHEHNPVTGETIDVTEYGARPDDVNHDNTPAILAAIEAAQAGDEVYFPNGEYRLKTAMSNDPTSHLYLKSKVNLRGESEEGVQLVSHFDMNETSNSKIMTAYGIHDVVISNMTLTSTFNGVYSDSPDQNNPDRGGPTYGIFIADSVGEPSSHIVIDGVTIEKFQRTGIRIEKSNKNIIQNTTFRNATDVGGGGSGYGVSIQGVQGNDRWGYPNDTYFNIVQDSTFEGPYMRHGTLIQYYAHNNLVQRNEYIDNIHDAIDLHGQGEYLNEIRHNMINGVIRGGIGVGNTGGTPPNNHSASGSGNYIHHNTLTNTRDGITVIMGSPNTIIEKNKIINTINPENAKGIYLLNAPGTIVKDNEIMNNTAPGFWAISLQEDPGDRNNDHNGAGIPDNITINNNLITGNSNGNEINVEAGTNLTIENNMIEKIKIEGTTVWKDVHLNDRPETFKISLLQNDEIVETKDITAEMDWKFSFENLSELDENGEDYTYTIEVDPVQGYETIVEGYDIINVRANLTSITAEMTWKDNDHLKRPDTFKVSLLQNGEVVEEEDLTAEIDWKYSFTNLPEYDENGEAYIYTIEGGTIEGYQTNIDGYNITNVQSGITSIEGEMIWEDEDLQEHLETFKVSLLQNGKVMEEEDITAETDWKYSFTNLPKYDENGEVFIYTIEGESTEVYQITVDGFDIILTSIPTTDQDDEPTEEADSKEETDENNKLPSTSTNLFNLMLVGFMLTLLGLVTLLISKVKKNQYQL